MVHIMSDNERFEELEQFILTEYHNVNEEYIEYIYGILCELVGKKNKLLESE